MGVECASKPSAVVPYENLNIYDPSLLSPGYEAVFSVVLLKDDKKPEWYATFDNSDFLYFRFCALGFGKL